MATAASSVPSNSTSMAVPATVARWVEEVAALTGPARIHWCDGSPAELRALRQELVDRGELLPLSADGVGGTA